MQWIDRALLHRAHKSIAHKGRRALGGSARPTEDVYRTRLIEALWSVHGMEIEDVFPAGAESVEVHR